MGEGADIGETVIGKNYNIRLVPFRFLAFVIENRNSFNATIHFPISKFILLSTTALHGDGCGAHAIISMSHSNLELARSDRTTSSISPCFTSY